MSTGKASSELKVAFRRHPLDAIFKPRNVAVIGATEKEDSVGRTLLWNLISNPFGGTVFPVNPKRNNILGIRAYPSIRDVPDQVDLAVIVTPVDAAQGAASSHPLALRLALKEGLAGSAYLARPCQYVPDSIRAQCSPADWTQARFSAEIVNAMNLVVDAMKQRFGARSIRLVGYSGGAAVAALVAARRQDVVQLVSVAGVLDHVGWARGLEVSPLSGSLNPADYWQVLQHVPQRHFVGGRDRQTGMHGIAGYLARFPPGLAIEVVVIDDFDHACCWEAAWPISSASSDSAR